MPDDVFYDAINLFKWSDVGRGRAHIPGSAEYQNRYRGLANDTINLLWRYWHNDEIAFHDFPSRNNSVTFGDSLARWGANIRISSMLRPDVAHYGTAANQARLAAVSHTLAHEGLHMAASSFERVGEEVACRYMQAFYFHELTAGRSYGSRVAGRRLVAELSASDRATTLYRRAFETSSLRATRHQLIDEVVSMETYRRHLTSDFIRRSITWWGGLTNRWYSTRGRYLNILAAASRHRNLDLIVEILESIPGPEEWQAAARMLDQHRLGSVLCTYDNRARIVAIERRTGANLVTPRFQAAGENLDGGVLPGGTR